MSSTPHFHDTQAHPVPVAVPTFEICPTCEQIIPPDRVEEIAGRVAARDRARAVDLTARLEQQFAQERAASEATLQRAKHAGEEALARLRTEAAQREALVRDQARQEATAMLEQRLGEQAEAFEQTAEALRGQLALSEEHRVEAAAALEAQRAEAASVLQLRLSDQAQEFEQSLAILREQLMTTEERSERALSLAVAQLNETHSAALRESEERHQQTAAAQLEELTRLQTQLGAADQNAEARVEAVTRQYEESQQAAAAVLEQTAARLATTEADRVALSEQLQSARDAHATEITRVVQETRDALEKDKTAAVHAEQAKRLEETQKLGEKLDDLKRQLERKTAEELGEGAELDLFEELKARFERDAIRRVPKGTAGADVVHEVRDNGIVCGKIVYDSKNRKDWKNEYAIKLRADQIAEHADHAVLATNKFPAGTKQLHLHEHVIIACPARVLAVAQMLRDQIVQLHTLRMSQESRDEKTQELYAFMTSPRCAQLFDAVNTEITKLEQIDAAELRAHQAVWDRRGKTVKSLEKAHGNLRFEVQRIVGGLNASEDL
jgi:hypothetical protein